MIELKRILLPADFSDAAAMSVRYACALADQFGAELHLLHVQPEIPPELEEYGIALVVPDYWKLRTDLIAALKESAGQSLDELLEPEWRRRHTVVQAVVSGKPFVEIVRYAAAQEIDLIVISTHGRSGLSHALLGSVTEKVVRKAPCPVLTVRPEGHQFEMP